MTDDIVARAWAAMEGINTPMPWRFRPWERGVGSSELTGARGVHMAWAIDDGDGTFIAQSPELVAKLVAEVERLRDVKAEWRMYCIRAESERDQLKAAVKRVQQMHSTKWECGNPRHTNPDGVCPECFVVCVTCDRTMPCPTVRELGRIDKEVGL